MGDQKTFSPMKTIQNSDKYITEDTLQRCFSRGSYRLVDKVLCGNGFSTRFLMTRPVAGHVNVLIAPNIQVVKGKEKEYLSGRISTPNKIGFFYEGCSTFLDNSFDVLVMVSDSFKYRRESLTNLSLDKILIDEVHSVESQGSFRKELVGFIDYVKEVYLERCNGVVGVSATPGVLADVDIEIGNGFVEETIIETSENIKSFILSIKKAIHEEKKIFVATNSPTLVYNIANERENGHGRRRLRANFMCGKTLLGNLCPLLVLEHDEKSNVVIGSSKAFEGHDLEGEGWEFFIYENRRVTSSQYRQENVYQIINRCRGKKGTICYFRLASESPEGMPRYSYEVLEAFANDPLLLPESKMGKSDTYRWEHEGVEYRYSEFHKYLIFEKSNTSVQVNTSLWRMHKEKVLNDRFRFGRMGGEYTEFWKKRNVVFLDRGEAFDPEDMKAIQLRIKDETKRLNLRDNHDFIVKNSLYSKEYLRFASRPCPQKMSPREHLGKEKQRMRKEIVLFLMKRSHDVSPDEKLNEYKERELTVREQSGLLLFTMKGKFYRLVSDCVDLSYARNQEKNWRDWKTREDLAENIYSYILELIGAFCNRRISAKPEIIGHRDYNIFTRPGVDIIQRVFAEFGGGSVMEIDIRSSFVRILYALCGKVVPDDIYGEKKEKKVEINKALNNFQYRSEKHRKYPKKTPKKIQRVISRKMLLSVGLDSVVVSYLMSEFFDQGGVDTSGLFNKLSHTEANLIQELRTLLIEDMIVENDGLIRRHDSVLIFNSRKEVEEVFEAVNSHEYLRQKNWFTVKKTPVGLDHILEKEEGGEG